MPRSLFALLSILTFQSALADYPASWQRFDSDSLEAALKSSRAAVQDPVCREFFKRAAKGFGELAWEKTSSLVVIKNQNVRLEYYDQSLGITSETPMKLWSGSKSIATLILGTAVLEGKLQLEDPLEKYLPFDSSRSPGWKAEDYARIRIHDLMNMTSGFEWTEIDETFSFLKKISPLWMLYSSASKDTTGFVLSRPMDPRGPGIYNYSSGDFSLMMAVLKKVYGPSYREMPWKNLFEPLGITSAHIEMDDAGVFVAGASIRVSSTVNDWCPKTGLSSCSHPILEFFAKTTLLHEFKMSIARWAPPLILTNACEASPNRIRISPRIFT